jgi:rhodanese-related sulfurtransferase
MKPMTCFLRTPWALALSAWCGFANSFVPDLSAIQAQESPGLSLSQNGRLTISNAALGATCQVEWASSVEGPWHDTWASLTNIVVTNSVMQVSVPMFYRLASSGPPLITNITAQASLALLAQHAGDTNFVILDIRTPAEYQPLHIKSAINLDFYSPSFESELSKLDRNKHFLVYCASGTRGGKALPIMSRLGFRRVDNMIGGMGAFKNLSGAQAYLEP